MLYFRIPIYFLVTIFKKCFNLCKNSTSKSRFAWFKLQNIFVSRRPKVLGTSLWLAKTNTLDLWMFFGSTTLGSPVMRLKIIIYIWHYQRIIWNTQAQILQHVASYILVFLEEYIHLLLRILLTLKIIHIICYVTRFYAKYDVHYQTNYCDYCQHLG